jgi:hypothetical protein
MHLLIAELPGQHQKSAQYGVRRGPWYTQQTSIAQCPHDRPVYATHSRVDVYHRASVAAVYDDAAGKAVGVLSASFRRLRWR